MGLFRKKKVIKVFGRGTIKYFDKDSDADLYIKMFGGVKERIR